MGDSYMQTVKYFNLVGDEDDIRSELFKRRHADTFSYTGMRLALPLEGCAAAEGFSPTSPLDRTRGVRIIGASTKSLLPDNHQKGKKMIMIVGNQEGGEGRGEGRGERRERR